MRSFCLNTLVALALIFSGGSAIAGGSNITIRGSVVLEANGRPVVGATIYTAPDLARACTDSEGRYTLSYPKTGETIQLIVVAPGLRIETADAIGADDHRFSFTMKAGAGAIARPPACQAKRTLVTAAASIVHGRVADENGNTLVGANVELVGHGQRALTDFLGNYTIVLSTPPARPTLGSVRITKGGYREGTAQTTLETHEWRRLDVLLERDGAEGSGGGSRAPERAEGGTRLR